MDEKINAVIMLLKDKRVLFVTGRPSDYKDYIVDEIVKKLTENNIIVSKLDTEQDFIDRGISSGCIVADNIEFVRNTKYVVEKLASAFRKGRRIIIPVSSIKNFEKAVDNTLLTEYLKSSSIELEVPEKKLSMIKL